MPRKYHITKFRRKTQQNAQKLCKSNKINLKEQNFMLHIEKLLKLNRKRKTFHHRALKSLNNFKDTAFTYEMALRLDNLYVEDAKSVSAKDLKIQGLRELNLIHLDLLQQQADQINEKDKKIRILEEDNKNLIARLDRIDRRVSLNINKKLSSIEPLTVDTFIAEEPCKFVDRETQTISRTSPIRNSITKHTPKPNTLYDKLGQEEIQNSHKQSLKNVEPINLLCPNNLQTLRTSPREKKNKKDVSPLNINSEALISDNVYQLGIYKKELVAETKINSCKKTKLSLNIEITPDIVKKDITDHSLRSRDRQKDFTLREELPEYVIDNRSVVEKLEESNFKSSSSLPDNEQQSTLEQKIVNKDNSLPNSLKNSILTTEVPYFLLSPHHPFVSCLSSEESSQQTQVEIPKWRFKNLYPLYVMEGTENLGDEIFSKRHTKPEHDERRRKRWDLQRMREQRQYEKLRERYDNRHNSPGVRQGSDLTLWPNSDSLLSVCVDSELPVCAFGQPLAVINQECFCVPWLAKNNQIISKKKLR